MLYDALTGIPTGVTMPLAPANMYAWGVAWNNNLTTQAYCVNDFLKDDLYYHDGVSSWVTIPDPAGADSRGMDFDGTDYWETDGAGSLWRFQPGVSQESIAIPEVTAQISGLTVFPHGSNLGIAVTTTESTTSTSSSGTVQQWISWHPLLVLQAMFTHHWALHILKRMDTCTGLTMTLQATSTLQNSLS